MLGRVNLDFKVYFFKVEHNTIKEITLALIPYQILQGIYTVIKKNELNLRKIW